MASNSGSDEVVVLIAVILLVMWLSDAFSDAKEITKYPQEYKCYKDNCKWLNSGRTTYQVHSGYQRIIYWDTDSGWPLYSIGSCIVRDEENWSCGKGVYALGFSNGEWVLEDTERYRHVSWLQWCYNITQQ